MADVGSASEAQVAAEGRTVTRDDLSARLLGPIPAHTPQGEADGLGWATGAGDPSTGEVPLLPEPVACTTGRTETFFPLCSGGRL